MRVVAVVGGALRVPPRLCEETLTAAPASPMKARRRPETAGKRALVDRRDEAAQPCGKGIAAVHAPPIEDFGTLRMPTPQRRCLAESYGFHPSRPTKEYRFFLFVAARTTGGFAVSGIRLHSFLFCCCCPLCRFAPIGAPALGRARPIVPLFSCRHFVFPLLSGVRSKGRPADRQTTALQGTIFLFFFVLFPPRRRRAAVGAKTRPTRPSVGSATSAEAPDGSAGAFLFLHRSVRHPRHTKAVPKIVRRQRANNKRQGKNRTEPIPLKSPPFFRRFSCHAFFTCRLLSWIFKWNCPDLSLILHVYILVFCAVFLTMVVLAMAREPPERGSRAVAPPFSGLSAKLACSSLGCVGCRCCRPFARDQSLPSSRNVFPIFFLCHFPTHFFLRLAAAVRQEKKTGQSMFLWTTPWRSADCIFFLLPFSVSPPGTRALATAGGSASLFSFPTSLRKIA